jgi:hypothetical protein
VREIESKIKLHARSRSEALQSFSRLTRRSRRPPATPPGGIPRRLPPGLPGSARARAPAPHATTGNRATKADVGNVGARLRRELAGELRDDCEVCVQASGERRGGLMVAGIDSGQESPNSGPRIAFKASLTPAPSSSRMRRISPSRRNGLVASAARISTVRCARACRQTASRERSKGRRVPPPPAAKARWQSQDQPAAAGDCRPCSAARRSASSDTTSRARSPCRSALRRTTALPLCVCGPVEWRAFA